MIDDATLQHIKSRGVIEVIVEREFDELMRREEPLRLKMGFDPSRPDIHLGHVVGLRKLRQFQELGHKVILIVGDWTAQIGDPSGQSVTRPMLTHEEVVSNAESYLRQFFRVVDKERAQVVWQSEWFGKFDLSNVIRLTSHFTLAQFLERDDFAERYRTGRPIAITEFLYPLLQAYDSVAIESDVEFGGTDQKFNLLVGRDLQAIMGQRSQQCFLMPILVGTDGVRKMSKSLDNYIAVDDLPNDMYGKVMSLPDDVLTSYFDLLTDLPAAEVAEMGRALESEQVHPMELKKRLAWDITGQFYGPSDANAAQDHFERVVQNREAPENVLEIETHTASGPVPDPIGLLVNAGAAKSRGEARRLLEQGAVEVDGEKVGMEILSQGLPVGRTIKAGRRRYFRIVRSDD